MAGFIPLAATTCPVGAVWGKPVRLMVDLPNEAEIVDLFLHQPGRNLLVASNAGDGFVVAEDEAVAQTKTGRQVLNVKGDVRAKACVPATGDHVAVISENGKFSGLPVG